MSDSTRVLLLDLYPNLETRTIGLELNQRHQIFIDKEHTETVQVTMFDSNHCPGSVIMLFEGKMGRVIHTGDFRF
jgi:DNA cross-link repair 1A protein